MTSRSTSANQTLLFQLVFGLGLLAAMVYGTRSLMFGGRSTIGGLVGILLYGVIVLLLDDKYWLFSAFCFGFRFEIPYVKFTGYELGSIVLVSAFFIRMALHREKLVSGNKTLVWAAVPFLSWMCLVWAMNPTGMFIFGSSTIGGRFYFKVILAYLSLICLSSMKLSDSGARQIVLAYVFGYVAYSIFRSVTYSGPIIGASASGITHYRYAYLGYVAAFFLSRYSVTSLLTRFWPFVGFVVTFGLTMYSGNRHMFGTACLVGLLAPFVFRRERAKTGILLLFAMIGIGVLVAGHGNLWRLPFSVQRTLSFLPGKWDSRLENYGLNDDFRSQMRMLAKEEIRASPWFGKGGFSLDMTEMSWIHSHYSRSVNRLEGIAYSGNWHDVWFGMAADFGIPLSVAWAFFMTVLLLHGKGIPSKFIRGSWSETAAGYFYLLIFTEFVNFFFNGGQSAKTAEILFILSGLLAIVENGASINKDSRYIAH